MHVGGRSPSPRRALIWSQLGPVGGAYAQEKQTAEKDPRFVRRALVGVADDDQSRQKRRERFRRHPTPTPSPPRSGSAAPNSLAAPILTDAAEPSPPLQTLQVTPTESLADCNLKLLRPQHGDESDNIDVGLPYAAGRSADGQRGLHWLQESRDSGVERERACGMTEAHRY